MAVPKRRGAARRCAAFLLVVLFAFNSMLPAVAFKTSWPFEAIHTAIMTEALAPAGFQPDAIADIDAGAASQDDIKSWKMFEETHHFDGNNIVGGYDYVRSQIKNSINTARDCYKDKKELHDARFKLGEAYHALQDFYSHSNWLEMCLYDRVQPSVFRWDLHSAFDESRPDGGADWFTAPLNNMPPRLKTGYFTKAEMLAAGFDVVHMLKNTKPLRTKMVNEAMSKHSGLRFATDAQYAERINGTNSFYRALSYAVDDDKKALLHWEINKDDAKQIEGSMRTPTGETLHELAKQLAIKDTQLFWQAHVERLLWRQYEGCANLIIPAFKGNAVPELVLNAEAKPLTRTQPLEGTITLRTANMIKRVRHPLRVIVKVWLEEVDHPTNAEANAQEKLLEFKTNEEQKIDLKSFTLVAGEGSGRLVVNACYECDPAFRPVTRKVDLTEAEPVVAAKAKTIRSSSSLDKVDGTVGDSFTLGVDYTVGGGERGAQVVAAESSTVQQIDGAANSLWPSSSNLTFLEGASVKARKAWTFQPTQPGVYEWSYQISTHGFGSTTGTQRIIVRPAKRLVIDSESINPTAGPTGPTLALRVTYHIVGLPAGDSVGVTEDSAITHGPLASSFPQTAETINSGHPSGVLEGSFIATAAGDYEWTYTIDAGPIGRITQTLPLHIDASQLPAQTSNNSLRDFELISATVQPPSGPAGRSFALQVRYRALNAAPAEVIAVEENDYVNFGGKTETHQTTYAKAPQGAVLAKTAAFVSKQPGKHGWNYTITAPGYKTLYGFVPFEVQEVEQAQRLSAQLQFNQITLAPGENKNCSIFISGYRGNTADPVEIIYPQMTDSWGTLPGQVQVFPGNESVLPQNMRGAGDYARAYAAGKGYRARETAPPAVTPIKIIVRQKGAGEVVLTLFVKVVKRGVSTIGTETPNSNSVDLGKVQGSPGTTSGGTSSSGPSSTANGAAGTTTSTSSTTTTNTSSSSSSAAAVDAEHKVVYVFKKATISTTAVAGITSTGFAPLADNTPKMTEFTTTNVSVPLSWSESKQGRAGTAQQTTTGTVNFRFPEKLTLISYESDPTAFTGTAEIKANATASFNRAGPGSAFNSGPVGLFVGESGQGVTNNAATKDSRSSYFSGGATFNLSWNDSPMVIERATLRSGGPSHQPRLLLQNLGKTVVGIGGDDVGISARVVAPYELEYVAEAGTNTTGEVADTSVKSGQVIAKLDPPKIILEAGKLPGVSVNVLLQNWKRDTAEPIEISYPGLGPMNMLPNNIRAVYAGGTQSPDALARLQTDGGVYRWPQSFEAAQGAKPGTYKVPMAIKQNGAAPAYLELEVQVVPSKNAQFGNSTALFNKGQTAGSQSSGIWSQSWKPTPNAVGASPQPVYTLPVNPVIPPVVTAQPTSSVIHVKPVVPAKPIVPVLPQPVAAQSATTKAPTAASTAHQKPPAPGGLVFRRTGPFITMTQGAAGGDIWRIEPVSNKITFTIQIFEGKQYVREDSCAITFTMPPETITVGESFDLRAEMTGVPSVYGVGMWDVDGVWVRYTAHSDGLHPRNLSTNNNFKVFKPAPTWTKPPSIKYVAIFNSPIVAPKVEMEWRYERVK